MKLIVDASIFIYANYHITKKFVDNVDSEQLAYRVIDHIQNIAFKHFPMYSVVLALDSIKCFRRDLYPEYKSNRSQVGIDKNLINDILRSKFMCYQIDGYEADDIAWMLSRNGGILLSNDDDFKLMLTSDNIKLFKYRSNQLITLTRDEWHIERILKICEGCSTDNIPSIKLIRFGRSLVYKIYHQFNELTLDALVDMNYISDYRLNELLVTYDKHIYPCLE